jgi:hypothetical protein
LAGLIIPGQSLPSCRAGQPVRLAQERLEAPQIEIRLTQREDVAGRSRREHAPRIAQRLAQLGDVDVDHLRRRLRWTGGPELLDETLRRDDLVRV